ncbi:MAG: YfhO family protein [Chitinophagaceae bacterium]
MFSLIIGGGIQVNEIFQDYNQKFLQILKTFFFLLVIILLITLITDKNLSANANKFIFPLSNTQEIKNFIDHFNWRQAIIIQCIIQCILLLLLITTYKKSRMDLFTAIVMLDLIINAVLQLPFTAVGRTKLPDIQTLIEASPKFPETPLNQNEIEITKKYPKTEKLIGGWGFYSKQIALNENLYYPLMLSSNQEYFTNGTHLKLMKKPFIFSLNNSIKYTYLKTGYTFWSLQTDQTVNDTLLIKQNYFKGWNAWVDGHSVPIFKRETSLIGIALAPGKHEVKLEFKRDIMKYLLILEWMAIAFTMIYLIRYYLIKYIFP